SSRRSLPSVLSLMPATQAIFRTSTAFTSAPFGLLLTQIPIFANSEIASAFRLAYQAGWQRECSQTLLSTPIPKGNRGSRGSSSPPQPKQLSAAEYMELQFSHSATHQSKARASACSRGTKPSSLQTSTRSSKKNCQS